MKSILYPNFPTLQQEVDTLIKQFKTNPGDFDDNVYECYKKCKQAILKAQKEENIPNDCVLYMNFVKYITKKLDI